MTTKKHDKVRVSIDLPESFLEQLELAPGESRKTAIETRLQTSHSEPFELIPLGLIDPNPFQPRAGIPFGDVELLADNIYMNGLLQIPQARLMPDGRYQLAFGHRRFKAYQYIFYNKFNDGFTHDRHGEFGVMPLVIRDLTDQKMYEFAASENSNRKDLNVIEVARSVLKATELGISQADAGRLHGHKSAGTTSDIVGLLGLPDEIITAILEDRLSFGHGRELRRALKVAVNDPHLVVKMARDAIANELRVRDLKVQVDKFVAERSIVTPPQLPLSPSTDNLTHEQVLEQVGKILTAAKAEAKPEPPAPPPVRLIKCPVCEGDNLLNIDAFICSNCGKVDSGAIVAFKFCPDCHHEQPINLKSLKFNNELNCSQCGAHNRVNEYHDTKPELKPEDKKPAPMPQAPEPPAEPTPEETRQRLKDELAAIADTIPLDQLQALIDGLKGE